MIEESEIYDWGAVRIEPWGKAIEYPPGRLMQCNDWCLDLSRSARRGADPRAQRPV